MSVTTDRAPRIKAGRGRAFFTPEVHQLVRRAVAGYAGSAGRELAERIEAEREAEQPAGEGDLAATILGAGADPAPEVLRRQTQNVVRNLRRACHDYGERLWDYYAGNDSRRAVPDPTPLQRKRGITDSHRDELIEIVEETLVSHAERLAESLRALGILTDGEGSERRSR